MVTLLYDYSNKLLILRCLVTNISQWLILKTIFKKKQATKACVTAHLTGELKRNSLMKSKGQAQKNLIY